MDFLDSPIKYAISRLETWVCSARECRLWVYNADIFCGLWTPIRTSDLTAEAKLKKFFGTPYSSEMNEVL